MNHEDYVVLLQLCWWLVLVLLVHTGQMFCAQIMMWHFAGLL
jgi:hypothetical protein